MSDTVTIERACAELINTYLFSKVWNEPVSEYRSNIVPNKLTARSVVGSFATTEGRIPLPTDREAYFVWSVGTDELRISLDFPDKTWVRTDECITTYRTKFDFYTVKGEMFHKCGVYLRYNANRRILFIAAPKHMLYKCTAIDTITNNQVFLTTYFDSDIVNNIKIVSFRMTTIDSVSAEVNYQQEIDRILLNANNGTVTIFKNGIEVTQGGAPVLSYNDYFDVIVDENIEFAFDVDLVTRHESPAYLSTRDDMWKQLIHIPKHLNPENRVYTSDTCDFYIRRDEGEMPYGLYMHRVAKASVTQVTHNDFGISLMVIDAYRDYLDEQEVTVHVVVRRHDKDNVLIREANYIQLLYVDDHDDQRIIDILCGLGPANIPWWRADNLEDAPYVKMLFDTPNHMRLDGALMDSYINTLGYHQVINLLCQRSLDTVVTKGFNNTLVLSKPMLYAGYEVYPLVYLNGRHVNFNQVSYYNTPDNHIFLTIDKDIVTRVGDVISVVFYLSSNNTCKIFTLDSDTLEVSVPYKDPLVYELLPNTDRESVIGANGVYNSGYHLVDSGDNVFTSTTDSTGNSRLIFNSSYIGGVFVIQNRYATYRLSTDVTEQVLSGESIVINLETVDNETEMRAPILNHESVSVFYNNQYLVDGVDYTVLTNVDKAKHTCSVELVIQTMDHYQENRNAVDILVNQDIIRDNSIGFMLGDKLYDDSPINLQYSNTTTIHVNGLLERNSINKGNYTLLPSGKYPSGSIWEIQTAVPKVISDFIAHYSSKNDDDRLEIMNEYFSQLADKDPDVIVLDVKHRIYSVFLNEVIAQVLAGNVNVVIDPDNYRLELALSGYKHIRDIDIIYRGLDQRFIDYYPQYINQEIPIEQKASIDYLIDTYLPKNQYPSLHSTAEECDTHRSEG